jgi:hypothetical protein
VKLPRHANVLDWRVDLRDGGLTGFWRKGVTVIEKIKTDKSGKERASPISFISLSGVLVLFCFYPLYLVFIPLITVTPFAGSSIHPILPLKGVFLRPGL